MRADRLLSILMLLQSKGRMTAQELAQRLEVSERTIYRDLEALDTAGVPIYTERGPGGGISLIGGYQTRLTGLTTPEIRALFLAAKAVPLDTLGLEQARDSAMLKLAAALPHPSRAEAEQAHRYFHLDTATAQQSTQERQYLDLIQQALWQEHRLSLLYREPDGALVLGTIAPYGLVLKEQSWHLVGQLGETITAIALHTILRLAPTDQSFQRPEQFDLAAFWHHYCSTTSVTKEKKRRSDYPFEPALQLASYKKKRGPQKKEFPLSVAKEKKEFSTAPHKKNAA
ncbi:WYL domain-containing protein [Thermosporothrix hazakensis]|uniref:WYL domain-containing protein n=1 Tax=Thermosporothrix hazakensis TaxID=644383 RepID=A0A326UGF8_THEHA|nr:YafY family protein [Thermosporothrix hazakensis]PZW26586.1 WYL domain-containing protein [Thermosporothrix hazakensis]GCE47712.1 transcriptional regulator [Thermosporothrix hazakensis]